MICFLDFDGVLHPKKAETDQLFNGAPVLWKLLRKYPNIDVVFSTSWRTQYSFDELVNFATYGGGEDLEHRFLGTTPNIRHIARQDECLLWLNTNAPDRSWFALEDDALLFNKLRKVYTVNSKAGLTESDIGQLSVFISNLDGYTSTSLELNI